MKGIKIEDLLDALDDRRVQSKILKITEKNDFENGETRRTITPVHGTATRNQCRPKNTDLSDYVPVSEYKKQQVEFNRKMNEAMEENRLLQKRNESLYHKIDSLESGFAEAEEKNRILTEENDRLSHQLHQSKRLQSEHIRELDYLKRNFASVMDLYEKYQKVLEQHRKYLSNIVSDRDIITFVSSCSQFDHLERLWDYCKSEILNDGDAQFLEILSAIFDYFFDVYNKCFDTPRYERNRISVGDTFDEEYHIRGKDSGVSGMVKRIDLVGYQSVTTGEIIKKSVVFVER